MRGKNILLLIVLGLISNITILFIQGPLWDDWTLFGLTFKEIALEFKGNGLYNSGIAHLHYFINILNGNGFWFARIFSLSFIVLWPILFYFILERLYLNNKQCLQIAAISIFLPFFSNSFGQIVLPYIICLNFHLLGILFLSIYIKQKKVFSYHLILIFTFILISYTTHSFLFFVIPVSIIILFINKIKDVPMKRIYIASGIIIFSIIIFLYIKSSFLVQDINGPYFAVDYNKITLKGLFISGPFKSLRHPITIIYGLIRYGILIFSKSSNIYFCVVLILGLFFFFNKVRFWGVPKNTRRLNLFILLISIILIFSALYPYGVVNKLPMFILGYTQRSALLLPFGLSLGIFAFIGLSKVEDKWKSLIYSILLGIFLTFKISLYSQYYFSYRIQKEFSDKYLSEFSTDSSELIMVNVNSKINIHNWAFYEYGGMLRLRNFKQNKLFIDLKRDDKQFIDGRGRLIEPDFFNKMFVMRNNYGIKDFNTSNYKVRKISINFSDDFLDIKKFVFLIIGCENISKFLEVKEIE